MENVLLDCCHCQGEGTCKNGIEGKSCLVCATRLANNNEIPARLWPFNKEEYYSSFSGLVCSCCGGLGKTDTLTSRMNKRMPAALASILPFVLLALSIVSGVILASTGQGEQLFFFLTTITSSFLGAVTTYYFVRDKR
ncbi:hypothetical protein [Klebsiella sp. BIGb0407]|uniref:hypothetical protein n=1 Tax=Klebsiella sp. BIGb0407 TaxID=2940603 RepID=UPI0021688C7C|nr:hypothetical protein [Klebsiella sp. BIGb0407]MCS3434323.1 hypothetical protein [Klebsiella sp. BIGb0407]